jgi:hypothetical protein
MYHDWEFAATFFNVLSCGFSPSLISLRLLDWIMDYAFFAFEFLLYEVMIHGIFIGYGLCDIGGFQFLACFFFDLFLRLDFMFPPGAATL